MNIFLFEKHQCEHDYLKLDDRQLLHAVNVLQAKKGDTFKYGVLNDSLGIGSFDYVDEQAVLKIQSREVLQENVSSFSIILALPRVKMLKRIIHTLAQLGATDIYLINSFRVEKSFWSSPFLTEVQLHEMMKLGLEQAGDVFMPRVHLRQGFKPFVEDELPALFDGHQKILAHPKVDNDFDVEAVESDKPLALIIGPEGGFIDYEIKKLEESGFQALKFGDRILKVETAVPYILGKLLP